MTTAFEQLYKMRFPIHHMALSDEYGPVSGRPKDGDITASTEYHQAVPSPCSKGTGTGSWSMHAYGEAIDINPVENPYVGCGQTRDKTAVSFMKRTPLRRGMVITRRPRRLPLGRLGLGRLLVRVNEGLHALLDQRALKSEGGGRPPPVLSVERLCERRRHRCRTRLCPGVAHPGPRNRRRSGWGSRAARTAS